ncbi:hypothetical protein WME88_00445 [Sorangium sp. So ce216]
MNITDPAQPRELLQRLLAAAGPEAEEELVTIADYLREQGRLAGEHRALTRRARPRDGAPLRATGPAQLCDGEAP